ncbi:hypothetical protein SSBR45G_44410 [Bradyrhizobium sp. SSBR45G]|uniref:hypothetical protein n=1 Tax=unclassified Bradyrhizobium TaxID=2631580 RepID=UPI0023429DF2|nr:MULTISPECIES: hypothetical protein [unclassified Bradyrhizobium]GLH79532.1 hypothetical protein SSBR45G_44410 [Bradyrhizobium sp. SSBR45G]GLH86909.1 hypothetical protein SSBR45R_43690 [Bradyrhizobium sp. SSBR45R]
MESQAELLVSKDLLSDLERRFFWWEPVGSHPRSPERILAQAMSFAGFDEIVKLETELGPDVLADVMVSAQPGWIDARSWEFWRGRLMRATGRAIPPEAPARSFDVGAV